MFQIRDSDYTNSAMLARSRHSQDVLDIAVPIIVMYSTLLGPTAITPPYLKIVSVVQRAIRMEAVCAISSMVNLAF